jgi:hypothetical protein
MGQALNQQEFREVEKLNDNLRNIDNTLKKIYDSKSRNTKNPQTEELINVLKEINISLKNMTATIKEEAGKLRPK